MIYKMKTNTFLIDVKDSKASWHSHSSSPFTSLYQGCKKQHHSLLHPKDGLIAMYFHLNSHLRMTAFLFIHRKSKLTFVSTQWSSFRLTSSLSDGAYRFRTGFDPFVWCVFQQFIDFLIRWLLHCLFRKGSLFTANLWFLFRSEKKMLTSDQDRSPRLNIGKVSYYATHWVMLKVRERTMQNNYWTHHSIATPKTSYPGKKEALTTKSLLYSSYAL